MMRLCSVLFVLFTGLKLAGYIDWSWWKITAPLWGGGIAWFIFFVGYIIVIEAFGSPAERLALRKAGYIKW